jgi:hypothetical protein
MKKLLILSFFVVSSLTTSLAQGLRKNSISIGLGGNNPIMGINYAHKFKINETQTRFWEFGVGTEVLMPLAAGWQHDSVFLDAAPFEL